MIFDVLLSIGSIILSFSLIPQIIDSIKHKTVDINNLTLSLTIFGISIILIAYIYMGLWFSVITNVLCLLSWIFLLVFKNKLGDVYETSKK